MMDSMMMAQTLGFVSFALGVCTFYQKDDKKLKTLMMVFHFNHLIHFLLLGSMISVLSSALSACRTATSIYTSSFKVALVFIVISLGSGLYMMDSLNDLWPVLGTVIGTYTVFALKGVAMRVGFLIGALCWLTNNIMVGSIGGSLLEVTLISVNLVTMSRLMKQTHDESVDENETREPA
ncbi:YgjV family protein [Vibrio sp. WXL210]|uniref:YgjV family protein n=1 Tax=Vibrio sp. WXL210 TaxID=3450709 RepID=UPI003EC7534E